MTDPSRPGRSWWQRLAGPFRRRDGLERVAFAAFLLGVLFLHRMAIANVSLAVCALLTLSVTFRAGSSGAVWRRFGPSPLHPPIAAFVLLSVLSCFFSTLPSRSLQELKGLTTFLLFPLALFHVRDEEDVDLVLDVWRLLAFYLVARGALEWFSGMDSLEARLAGGLSVYMTYAGLLLPLILLLLARGLSPSPGLRRGLDLAAAAGGTLAVALTYTRSAYLGLGLGALVLLLSYRPRFALLLPPVMALLFLSLPASVKDRALSSFDPGDGTLRDRVSMWKSGLMMVRDRPFFGMGPGRVKEVFPAYRREDCGEPNPGHLHDNVLMVAAETGVPSAVVYVGFVGLAVLYGLRRSRRGLPPGPAAAARGSAAAMVALFAAGLFEYNFGDVEVLRATLVTAALPFVVRPGVAAEALESPSR